MKRHRHLVLATAVLVSTAAAALAGGTSLDDRDELQDQGPSIAGWVRNVAGGAVIDNARVEADSKVAASSLVTRTDLDGAFRFSGLGEDFPIDAIELTCAKDGFRMVDIITRRLSKDPKVPLEVECVLERK